MLSIIKKIKVKVVSFMILSICLFSCQKGDVNAIVYKEGSKPKEFSGSLYSTKYGGLNYYISDENERNELFKFQNIDSIVFVINKNNYTAKPLVRKSFSRERNNSDFSFSIDEEERKIIVDTIDNISTLSIFSEKTDMEKMKDDGIIKYTFIGEKDTKKK